MDDRRPNGLTRRVVRAWWNARKESWERIPRPHGEPSASAEGPDPARVLLLGDGPAMGFGVTSHDLALPGHLARQAARATGRGVRVDLITDLDLDSRSALAAYRERAGTGHDVLVVLLGSVDAVRLTRVSHFAERVGALLDQATCDGVRRILIVGIPSFAAMPVVPRLPGRLAQRHAPALVAALESAARRRVHARFVPFSPPPEPSTDRYRSSETYGRWAALISPHLAAQLEELRDEGPRRAPEFATRLEER
ncbi:hypothetical protein [Antiquaquibacter soli]|uniref:SGNH/GDSL hydrolase family protein n=1 Tax=Antiquaquibacter soli TaxID=3064523 RepID=A0ABT9BR31_9MICO|nr:hypothetical protein [Protaetiibacter sp. WY-16]MDO7883472.1 hypothetical protein [Protaetiibacter sp. WY-16]